MWIFIPVNVLKPFLYISMPFMYRFRLYNLIYINALEGQKHFFFQSEANPNFDLWKVNLE